MRGSCLWCYDVLVISVGHAWVISLGHVCGLYLWRYAWVISVDDICGSFHMCYDVLVISVGHVWVRSLGHVWTRLYNTY